MNLNNIITNFKTMSNEVITFFPDIQTLLKLLMVSPASSCDTERSFIALRISKTWLRNSMTQRRLNAIMIFNIHKEKLEELEELDIDDRSPSRLIFHITDF